MESFFTAETLKCATRVQGGGCGSVCVWRWGVGGRVFVVRGGSLRRAKSGFGGALEAADGAIQIHSLETADQYEAVLNAHTAALLSLPPRAARTPSLLLVDPALRAEGTVPNAVPLLSRIDHNARSAASAAAAQLLLQLAASMCSNVSLTS